MLLKIEQFRKQFWQFRHAIKLFLVGSITKTECNTNLAALTFDDGPHPIYTPMLLDLLAAYDAKATFFVTGDQAALHPELIQRIKDEQHSLGCHSWDHPSFPLISFFDQITQFARWQGVVKGLKGTKVFRPPYGNQSLSSHLVAKLLGYKTIMWSVIAQDWLGHSSKTIFDKLDNQLHPGAIVLLHDNLHDVIDGNYLNRNPTIDATTQLLKKHSSEYSFVSIHELLKQSKKTHKKLLFGRPNKEFLNSLQSPHSKAEH